MTVNWLCNELNNLIDSVPSSIKKSDDKEVQKLLKFILKKIKKLDPLARTDDLSYDYIIKKLIDETDEEKQRKYLESIFEKIRRLAPSEAIDVLSYNYIVNQIIKEADEKRSKLYLEDSLKRIKVLATQLINTDISYGYIIEEIFHLVNGGIYCHSDMGFNERIRQLYNSIIDAELTFAFETVRQSNSVQSITSHLSNAQFALNELKTTQNPDLNFGIKAAIFDKEYQIEAFKRMTPYEYTRLMLARRIERENAKYDLNNNQDREAYEFLNEMMENLNNEFMHDCSYQKIREWLDYIISTVEGKYFLQSKYGYRFCDFYELLKNLRKQLYCEEKSQFELYFGDDKKLSSEEKIQYELDELERIIAETQNEERSKEEKDLDYFIKIPNKQKEKTFNLQLVATYLKNILAGKEYQPSLSLQPIDVAIYLKDEIASAQAALKRENVVLIQVNGIAYMYLGYIKKSIDCYSYFGIRKYIDAFLESKEISGQSIDYSGIRPIAFGIKYRFANKLDKQLSSLEKQAADNFISISHSENLSPIKLYQLVNKTSEDLKEAIMDQKKENIEDESLGRVKKVDEKDIETMGNHAIYLEMILYELTKRFGSAIMNITEAGKQKP